MMGQPTEEDRNRLSSQTQRAKIQGPEPGDPLIVAEKTKGDKAQVKTQPKAQTQKKGPKIK